MCLGEGTGDRIRGTGYGGQGFARLKGDIVCAKKLVNSYRDLAVWQLGMQLAEDVYRLTAKFPSEEKFGLVSQLRRATTSIPANIAEGHSRSSTKDFLRRLSIALGSLADVTTFIELAERLGFVESSPANKLLLTMQEERRMPRGLQASLRRKVLRDR
jgi:four helix bundle protein